MNEVKNMLDYKVGHYVHQKTLPINKTTTSCDPLHVYRAENLGLFQFSVENKYNVTVCTPRSNEDFTISTVLLAPTICPHVLTFPLAAAHLPFPSTIYATCFKSRPIII